VRARENQGGTMAGIMGASSFRENKIAVRYSLLLNFFLVFPFYEKRGIFDDDDERPGTDVVERFTCRTAKSLMTIAVIVLWTLAISRSNDLAR